MLFVYHFKIYVCKVNEKNWKGLPRKKNFLEKRGVRAELIRGNNGCRGCNANNGCKGGNGCKACRDGRGCNAYREPIGADGLGAVTPITPIRADRCYSLYRRYRGMRG